MKPGRQFSSVFCAVLCLGGIVLPFSATGSWAAGGQNPANSDRDSINELSVVVGKSVVMDFDHPVERVSVGLNDVAETTAISPTEVLINGKAPGQTSLIAWLRGGGRQFFNLTVRPDKSDAEARLDAARRQLRLEFPDEPITVAADNGVIFLRGRVHDLASSERAVEIASTALSSGGSADPNAAKGLLPGLPAPAASQGKVVNLLYVDVPFAEKQILLKVQFASVDLTKAKDMGINLFSLGLGNTIGGISTGQFSPPSISGGSTASGGTNGITGSGSTAIFSDELNFLAFFPGLKSGADIKALEQSGVVEVLAQPNVIATEGKQASFLAGGEYPYPVAQGGAAGSAPTITIMFKEYGVRLNFIPTITPRGTIRLQVAPEVSSLDFTNAVQVSGFRVPAISSRKLKTEVELSERQTFVIGGLLDKRETETLEKIPFIGDIPVLGKFFQSMTRTKTNTELIVLVTPELVDPIPAGGPQPELKYPVPFLPPNSSAPMHHPDGTPATASNAPLPSTIPVEKLIESQRPEKPLITDQGFSPTGDLGGGSGGTTPQ
jgi:pilus assembly protein CpaC